ncbi:hypothetical protein TROPICALSUN_94 [Erwinia phage vB_EamM_TropicalSun]|uniref:Uncharacterized protein n=1 Tax=Erwinia phage vB_EamM_TropicalSun TaxID=2591372 RepID=A0A5B9NSF0_9CAUD|nr:hypothetical protein TROPICALSUN_94 [Erwinia phage vB_EamM_TropicalSun]
MRVDDILIVVLVVFVLVGIFRIASGNSKREVWLVMGRDVLGKTTYVAGVFDNHDAAWKFCHHCSVIVSGDVFYLDRDLMNKPMSGKRIISGKRRMFIKGKMVIID